MWDLIDWTLKFASHYCTKCCRWWTHEKICCAQCCRSRTRFYCCNIARNIARNKFWGGYTMQFSHCVQYCAQYCTVYPDLYRACHVLATCKSGHVSRFPCHVQVCHVSLATSKFSHTISFLTKRHAPSIPLWFIRVQCHDFDWHEHRLVEKLQRTFHRLEDVEFEL